MKRKLEDFGELSAAEQKIVDEIDSGRAIVLHTQLPDETSNDYDVRAVFIQYLMLGGCEACRIHVKGLQIKGAHIPERIDVSGTTLEISIALEFCRFGSHLRLAYSDMKGLTLTGSYFTDGISLEETKFDTTLFLDHVESRGALNIMGIDVHGDVNCDSSKLFAKFPGADSNLGVALLAERMKVSGGFFFRGKHETLGRVALIGARVEALCDSIERWPNFTQGIQIDRFRYEAILGVDTPIDAQTRLKWLKNNSRSNGGFSPQPFEQLAKVLREMGHREDARVVLIEKERLQRAAANPPWWRRVWNGVMRKSAGYGYRPSLSLRYLAGLILFGMLVFGGADLMGAVKPNSARVWHLSAWEQCVDNPISPKWCYLLSEKGESYPAFNPIIYSIDTLLPIVDLEMQGAWIPDDRASWWGVGARLYLWLHIALGWFLACWQWRGFRG